MQDTFQSQCNFRKSVVVVVHYWNPQGFFTLL